MQIAGPGMRTYMYDLPFKNVAYGKVFARNLRAARRMLRLIFNCRSLPPKSDVWAAAR